MEKLNFILETPMMLIFLGACSIFGISFLVTLVEFLQEKHQVRKAKRKIEKEKPLQQDTPPGPTTVSDEVSLLSDKKSPSS